MGSRPRGQRRRERKERRGGVEEGKREQEVKEGTAYQVKMSPSKPHVKTRSLPVGSSGDLPVHAVATVLTVFV